MFSPMFSPWGRDSRFFAGLREHGDGDDRDRHEHERRGDRALLPGLPPLEEWRLGDPDEERRDREDERARSREIVREVPDGPDRRKEREGDGERAATDRVRALPERVRDAHPEGRRERGRLDPLLHARVRGERDAAAGRDDHQRERDRWACFIARGPDVEEARDDERERRPADDPDERVAGRRERARPDEEPERGSHHDERCQTEESELPRAGHEARRECRGLPRRDRKGGGAWSSLSWETREPRPSGRGSRRRTRRGGRARHRSEDDPPRAARRPPRQWRKRSRRAPGPRRSSASSARLRCRA